MGFAGFCVFTAKVRVFCHNLSPTRGVPPTMSPAYSRVTFLKDMDLSRRDYTIKVHIIHLWKQPNNNNPAD
ncbi:hypothetical protein L1987_24304 [Smallanthus sonchifolius]|uniref:Uncharacterized protein n=1 Tax=Smallanthus sonchifolius TaxID=185202 RepID=A0ACB9ILU1_9ASTR|nr:hypothetical protein L1987_24304 [Smallanthus sonchifolius]